MKNKKAKAIHYRQGDVLIERIGPMPANLVKVDREAGKIILAHGEVTGHAHAITDRHADLFTAEDRPAVTYLEIRDAMASLQHEEHSTINLPPGNYVVTRQREYSPEAIRNVAD